MERLREPNRGLWSPCGGKLDTLIGESPYACACREAREEIGIAIRPLDLHLAGIVTEASLAGRSHWQMFLFEIKPPLACLPEPHAEGRFAFIDRVAIPSLKIPETDRQFIWPLFWKFRRGFFSAHCQVKADESFSWELNEAYEPR